MQRNHSIILHVRANLLCGCMNRSRFDRCGVCGVHDILWWIATGACLWGTCHRHCFFWLSRNVVHRFPPSFVSDAGRHNFLRRPTLAQPLHLQVPCCVTSPLCRRVALALERDLDQYVLIADMLAMLAMAFLTFLAATSPCPGNACNWVNPCIWPDFRVQRFEY